MVEALGTSDLAGSALGAPGALGTPPDGDAMEGAECATGGGGGRVGAFAAGASKTLVPGSSGGTVGSEERVVPPSSGGAPSGLAFFESSRLDRRRSKVVCMSLKDFSIPSNRAPNCSTPVARYGLTTVTSGLFARGVRAALRSVRLVSTQDTPTTTLIAATDKTILRVLGCRLLSD